MKVQLRYAQFNVQGSTDEYLVVYDDEEGWYCNCPDRHYRKHECKHIKETKKHLEGITVEEVIPETQTRPMEEIYG